MKSKSIKSLDARFEGFPWITFIAMANSTRRKKRNMGAELKLPYSLSLYLFFLILQISKHSTDIADHNRHSKSISLFENSGFQLEFESYPNVSCAHAVMQWIWFQVMYWFERSLSLALVLSFCRVFFLGTIKSNGMNSFIAKVSFLKRATLLDKSKLQLLLKTFQEFHRNELYYVDGKRCSSSQLNFMSTLFFNTQSLCV